jgi:hypothetical protein
MEEKPKITGYAWRPGSQHKVAADVVAMEIDRLTSENGGKRIDANGFLAASSSPTSPVYPEFNWDDSAAAHEFRLQQARNILNSLQVTIERPNGGAITVPLMVTVEKPGSAGRKQDYTNLAWAMSDEDLRTEVLRNALRELAAFKRKYATLSELAQVFVVIDRTVKKQFG